MAWPSGDSKGRESRQSHQKTATKKSERTQRCVGLKRGPDLSKK